MLLGCAAAVLGGWTRARCYALLGQRFTFELATHGARQPALVTAGPYAVVRHPSYSAACLAFYGACAVFLSPKSAIRLSGGPGRLVMALILFLLVAPLRTLPRRVALEEQMLADEFGDRWKAYTARVRSKMIPGVY
ncbi:hypothetical protein AURDEDRAFT_71816 [Auricularia subglabra TFB-10046 SS5]|nr:hypothetical protein AURDEDRAFT_71816 [Auricularia subglabra TFB-10046 SS5]